MANFTDDSVHDAALALLSTCTTMTITSAQPANLAGVAAVALCSYTIDGSDFAISDNPAGGRRVTVAAQTGVASAGGSGNHACLDDGVTLLRVTTVPAKTVVNGEACNTTAYDIFYEDPA